MRILIVEDNLAQLELLRSLLNRQGFDTDTCTDGAEGLYRLELGGYDLAILDRMLPGLDGMEVLTTLRREGIETPVIFLTALGQLHDRTNGLNSGADDYIVKPFAFEELLARIRAALRISHRSLQPAATGGVFQLADLTIDYDRRIVSLGGERIHLTQTEYNILALLSHNTGKVMTYSKIICQIWGSLDDGSVKKLQVNMANIRRKLGCSPGDNRFFVNELGVGYRMLDES